MTRPPNTLADTIESVLTGRETTFSWQVFVNGAPAKPEDLTSPLRADAPRLQRLMLASLRYLDTLVKIEGTWLFAERLLYVDWLNERALS